MYGRSNPYSHISCYAAIVKTTLIIDDTVMALLRCEAARRRCTMSELVESSLRLALEKPRTATRMSRLPVFRGGKALVDIADRDALYHAMEGR